MFCNSNQSFSRSVSNSNKEKRFVFLSIPETLIPYTYFPLWYFLFPDLDWSISTTFPSPALLVSPNHFQWYKWKIVNIWRSLRRSGTTFHVIQKLYSLYKPKICDQWNFSSLFIYFFLMKVYGFQSSSNSYGHFFVAFFIRASQSMLVTLWSLL